MAEIKYDNSLKSQQQKAEVTNAAPPEPIAPVAKGTAVSKETKLRKLKNQVFVSSAKEVGKTFWTDNLLPGIKHSVLAALSKWILGTDYAPTTQTMGNRIQRVAASAINVANQQRQQTQQTQQTQPLQNTSANQKCFDTLFVYESRAEAMAVLDQLKTAAEKYGKVRVSDIYEYSGITDFQTAWLNWGWSEASIATIAPKFNPMDKTYYIEMPPASPFNQI